MHAITRIIAALLVALLLAGCGGKLLDGTYVPNNEQSYTYDKLVFSPNGKVIAWFNGNPIPEHAYDIAGNQVQLHINQWPHNLDIRSDGCLVGTGQSNMNGVYCKQTQ